MTNPSQKQELYEKIKTLSLKDLKAYESSAKSAGRFINVIGVLSILGALTFSSGILMFLVAVSVYVLGQISAGLSDTVSVIKEQIAKLEKT